MLKKCKHLICTALVLILCLQIFPIAAVVPNLSDASSNDRDHETYKQYPALFDEAEYALVLEAVKEHDILRQNRVLDYHSALPIEQQIISPYKLQYLFSDDFDRYLTDGCDALQFNTYEAQWILPTNKGFVIKLNKDENEQWQVSGYQEASDTAASDTVDFSALDGIENVSSVICVYVPEYYTSFLCCTSSQGDYIVPFCAHFHSTDFVNGKAYSADEMRAITLPMMEEYYDRDPMSNSGIMPISQATEEATLMTADPSDAAPESEQQGQPYYLFALAAGGALLIVAGVIVVIYKKAKKTSPHAD